MTFMICIFKLIRSRAMKWAEFIDWFSVSGLEGVREIWEEHTKYIAL
jgi:hypothetical protein